MIRYKKKTFIINIFTRRTMVILNSYYRTDSNFEVTFQRMKSKRTEMKTGFKKPPTNLSKYDST